MKDKITMTNVASNQASNSLAERRGKQILEAATLFAYVPKPKLM